jgi:hypothetical protein
MRAEITLEEFRLCAAQTGLRLTEEDIVLLHQGYLGMQRLMARIPADPAPQAEPAHVFRPLAGRRR